jgi:membrane protease YdiL (CAAX protease family)
VHYSVDHGQVNRVMTYASTGGMELVLVGWVLFGLRLRHVSLRSILGPFSFRPMALIRDAGVALVFWFAALFVLGSMGLAWNGFEHSFRHEPEAAPQKASQTESKPSQTGSLQTPAAKLLESRTIPIEPSQQEALRALKMLAPDGAREMAVWALLCVLVGFCEELIFRGYLQRQCMALARGNVVAGIAMSAAVFGSAHAYQGPRNMVLLAVFGALFGVLAWTRGSLRAGMMAHGWHDLCAGVAISMARSLHLI